MTDNVVLFADMAFKLRGARLFPDDRCEHKKVTLDDNGGIVTCDDCGRQLDAYLTLRRMCAKWDEHKRELDAYRDRLAREAEGSMVLRAARQVEKAWRSRSMAPICPHCGQAILPQDGFGTAGFVNLQMELHRRKFKQSTDGR
jgi:ribosomal protein S27E